MANNRRGNRTRNKKWESLQHNAIKETGYLSQIEALALNRFKWVNLPETCNERYLEYTLLHSGMALIAKPDNLNVWINGKMGNMRGINIYNEPIPNMLITANGLNFNVNPNNCVAVWDSQTRKNPWGMLVLWAGELADIDRTRDVNRAHVKQPVIFKGPRQKKNDLQNLAKQVMGGEPAVIVYDGLEENGIGTETLNNNVHFYGEELNADSLTVWNKIYNFLGIDNLPTKKERMIEEEVLSTNEPTSLIALNHLNARRAACKRFNELTGLDLWVEWHLPKYSEVKAFSEGVNDGIL